MSRGYEPGLGLSVSSLDSLNSMLLSAAAAVATCAEALTYGSEDIVVVVFLY
jgi:hypothetical protein